MLEPIMKVENLMPEDFMFQLSKEEFGILKTQIATSSKD